MTTDRTARQLTVVAAAADDVSVVVDPLFREYSEWVAGLFDRNAGIVYTDADVAGHHDAMRGELPQLHGPRARLLVALLDDTPVGVGALKPVDETTAEVKRMYVRPAAQGIGVGRAILTRLVQAARAEHYTTVRLETLRIMTAAQALYRTFGFVDVAKFDGSELADTVLEPLAIHMELDVAAWHGRP